jgi:perosamine synthetase
MVLMPSPARQRLYTTVSSYAKIFGDIATGRVHQGRDVDVLEESLRNRLGVPHVMAVNQCRVGIYLAIKATITETRRKVIISPFTIFDVVNMVIAAGAQPVFADIEAGSCTLDPADVEALIDDETAAVMITHSHVLCPSIDRIIQACRPRGIKVFEDAAIAFGMHRDGQPAGTLADVGIYSFGLFKNVSAIYGGAVVTHDQELHERMKAEHDTFKPVAVSALIDRLKYSLTIDTATHPLIFKSLTYWVFRYGMFHDVEWINKRTRNDPSPFRREDLPESLRRLLSPAQARLILDQLETVDAKLEQRLELACLYHSELQGLDGVELPPMYESGRNAYLVFPFQVEDREALLRHLMIAGRDCASYYYRNCSLLDCFADFKRDCPRAQSIAEHTVLLPTYPGYGLKEAAKNVAVLRDFFAGR